MERRLGRGLGSLLGGSDPEGSSRTEAANEPRDRAPVSALRPNPFQPRKIFAEEQLQDLTRSIAQHGVLQPICVRSVAQGFEIIAGERRWRAAQRAGLTEVPVVEREGVDDREMLELALVENVQRQDLDALEKARGYQEMIDRLRLTQAAVAERMGLDRSSVANHLRLLDLPAEAQEALSEGLIQMGHARALLAVDGRRERLDLLACAVRDDLSVRAVEALARGAKPARRGTKSGNSTTLVPQAPWVTEVQTRLREALGTQVEIVDEKGSGGRIVIRYHDHDELDRLIERLAPADGI